VDELVRDQGVALRDNALRDVLRPLVFEKRPEAERAPLSDDTLYSPRELGVVALGVLRHEEMRLREMHERARRVW
jgi:hypothetical protein